MTARGGVGPLRAAGQKRLHPARWPLSGPLRQGPAVLLLQVRQEYLDQVTDHLPRLRWANRCSIWPVNSRSRALLARYKTQGITRGGGAVMRRRSRVVTVLGHGGSRGVVRGFVILWSGLSLSLVDCVLADNGVAGAALSGSPRQSTSRDRHQVMAACPWTRA